MDKLYSSPMLVVRSLDVEKDSLKPRDGVQGMLGLEVLYFRAIGPTNTIGWESRISFDISKAPHITWPILGISEKSKLQYHHVGYLNDPHNVYLHGRSVTLLMSSKQTSVTTPTNHSGIQSRVTCVALQNDRPHTWIMWYWFSWIINHYLYR
jgi:hypothetical protein